MAEHDKIGIKGIDRNGRETWFMSISLPNPDKKYNYHDYLQCNDESRYEIINGVPYNITPAPSRVHQRISRDLMLEIGNYLRGKKCEIYDAPFDVRLLTEGKTDKDILDVVQPDFAVICDPPKLDDHGCNGSPDFIIEILSPATGKHDRLRKYNLYE